MPAPPKEGPSFSPNELRVIATAYDAVLSLVNTDSELLARIPHGKLHHQLAALLVTEAGHGPIEARRLERSVLTSLRVLAGLHIDELLAVEQRR